MQVQSPEQAFNQSRAKLLELTGRTAPDLVMIASGMWCVRRHCAADPGTPVVAVLLSALPLAH